MDNIENERTVNSSPGGAGENIIPSKTPLKKQDFSFPQGVPPVLERIGPALPASGIPLKRDGTGKLFHPWQARLQLGKKQGALAGRHQGGMTPFGYRRDYNAAQKRFILKINPSEASVVRHIFNRYLKLKSLEKLAAKLEKTKVRTRKGNLWSRPALGFLLNNEIYLGKIKYGGIKTQGQHQPIIGSAIFNRVQKLKGENRKA